MIQIYMVPPLLKIHGSVTYWESEKPYTNTNEEQNVVKNYKETKHYLK
jgi:hypothetical protein